MFGRLNLAAKNAILSPELHPFGSMASEMRNDSTTSDSHSSDPIELVSRFVTRQDWYLHRQLPDRLMAEVPGHWAHYHLSVTWQADEQSLLVCCGFDLSLDMARLRDMAMLVCQLNEQLWIGHFVLEPETANLHLRYRLALRGANGATPEQVEEVVDILLGQAEQAYPAIFAAAAGQTPLMPATRLVMMQPQGEA